MKQARSLRSRITLVMLAFGLLMILMNRWWTHEWMMKRHLARLQTEAVESASPLSGIMQHLLRRKQERAAELELSYAALAPRLELGLVCDPSGKVRFATQLQWRGLNIRDTPLGADWPEIAKVLLGDNAVHVWRAKHAGLVVASQFYEGYDASSKGVLVMLYDYALELEELKSDALHDFLRQVCVLAALCLLMWQTLDAIFVRRVIELLDNIHDAPSKSGPPPVLAGSDELSAISDEFAKTIVQLREAESFVLEAAEEERRRIGRELHDDLCQRITAAKLKAEVVHGIVPEGQQKQADLTRQLAEELAESADIARNIARGLSPVGLEKDGLEDALQDVAYFMERAFSVRCTTTCAHLHGRLSENSQELLFRIAQELVVNAGKHSRPQNLSVAVSLKADRVELLVMHDGSPFYEPADTKTSGMGLHLMRQRLLSLSATLERTVRAGPPEISITRVQIPLKPAVDA